MLWSLAARNLWRNGRRTAITVAAVAFGLMMMLYTITMQSGQYDQMIRTAVGSLAGHVVVQAPGYGDDSEQAPLVSGVQEIQAAIEGAVEGAVVAPRTYLGGLLVSPTGSVAAAVSGVTPGAEARVQDLDEKLVEGDWLSDDRGILIGVAMARSLDVELGDKVVYMGQHGDADEVSSRLFRVRGIFRTGGAELDGFAAVVHIDATRELLNAPDSAHRVTVHVPDAAEFQRATDATREVLGHREDIEVLSWMEALPELFGMIELDRVSGDIVLGILGTIVAMGVLNTVLMSTLERTREFGVMLAIGMKPREIAAVVLLEGMTIGLLGTALGMLAGFAVSWPLVTYGLDLSSFMGADTIETAGITMSAVLFGQYNLSRSLAYAAAAVGMTTLAALYPALHVARLKPVAAMNHV